jgi:hypothetical protein
LGGVKFQGAPARRQVLNCVKFCIAATNQLHQLQASCQISIYIAATKAAFPLRGGCAENLKKLEIYDIIKG